MGEGSHREPRAPKPPPQPLEGGDVEDIEKPAQKGPARQDLERGSEDHPNEPKTRRENISAIDEYPTRPVPYREGVAERLAYFLLGLLGATIFVHYIMSAILIACYRDKYETVAREFDKIFNNLLPILSGLVGSAVTYYFTRDTRSS